MVTWTTIGERWPRPDDYPASENPFVRDDAGRIKSPSAISAAIKADKSRARAMCRSAGESLDKWFPENPR